MFPVLGLPISCLLFLFYGSLICFASAFKRLPFLFLNKFFSKQGNKFFYSLIPFIVLIILVDCWGGGTGEDKNLMSLLVESKGKTHFLLKRMFFVLFFLFTFELNVIDVSHYLLIMLVVYNRQ